MADKKRRLTSYKPQRNNALAKREERSKKRHSSFFEDRSFGDTCRVFSPVGLKLVSFPHHRHLILGRPRGENAGLRKKKTRSNRDNGPPRLTDKSHCVKVSFVLFRSPFRTKSSPYHPLYSLSFLTAQRRI